MGLVSFAYNTQTRRCGCWQSCCRCNFRTCGHKYLLRCNGDFWGEMIKEEDGTSNGTTVLFGHFIMITILPPSSPARADCGCSRAETVGGLHRLPTVLIACCLWASTCALHPSGGACGAKSLPARCCWLSCLRRDTTTIRSFQGSGTDLPPLPSSQRLAHAFVVRTAVGVVPPHARLSLAAVPS